MACRGSAVSPPEVLVTSSLPCLHDDPACRRGAGSGAAGACRLCAAGALRLGGRPLCLLVCQPRAMGGHARGGPLLPPRRHRCTNLLHTHTFAALLLTLEPECDRPGLLAVLHPDTPETARLPMQGRDSRLTNCPTLRCPAGECRFSSPVWGPLKGQIERESTKASRRNVWHVPLCGACGLAPIHP